MQLTRFSHSTLGKTLQKETNKIDMHGEEQAEVRSIGDIYPESLLKVKQEEKYNSNYK